MNAIPSRLLTRFIFTTVDPARASTRVPKGRAPRGDGDIRTKEGEEDKLMEQVRVQLQQLIKEKSDLTALNERLARENEQLHGFLSHMSASDEEDD